MGTASPVRQRQRLVYEGHVQGVGFRYTTRSIARGYDVTGFVRNLPDGSVEVVADGPEDQLDGFVHNLDERMSGHIRHVQRNRLTTAEEFADFAIRY